MISDKYRRQVELLLAVLPEVAREERFALHGGTAINLFVRDMPRLSVDIDLTYLPIGEEKKEDRRATAMENIGSALLDLQRRLERRIAGGVRVANRSEKGKLLVGRSASSGGAGGSAEIKIEVNLVGRGAIGECLERELCGAAQTEFDAYCAIRTVPFGQLYGGKLVAALDRQHPRDLFDVKLLLENEGLTGEIKAGLMLALMSSARPIHELLDPTPLDQRAVLQTHFDGMTATPFGYEDFEAARGALLAALPGILGPGDRSLLLGFCEAAPRWDELDFSRFPAVAWKLQNLENLRQKSPEKFGVQSERLRILFGSQAWE